MQVPTSAANFVELEALRWENRKLCDAKAVAETEVRSWDPLRASSWLPERDRRGKLTPLGLRAPEGCKKQGR